MIKIVKGTNTDKWLPKYWRKCTFPILKQPAKTTDDLIASAFLLHYREIPYIVTADHVVQTEDPVIVFSKKDRTVIGVKSSDLEEFGLKWVSHPAKLDIAAIPFHLPLSLVKELDIKLIKEDYWATQSKLKTGSLVAHLGYPVKGMSNYSDGSPSLFPVGMPGEIIAFKNLHVTLKTASAHGASGGPLFLKRVNKPPLLIGVVVLGRVFEKSTRPEETIYLNETKVLPISLVKDILESEQMKEQYNNRKIPLN